MGNGEKRKQGSRAARLEAQLRANLKKRKEQARARARTAAADVDEACPQKDSGAESTK